MGEGRYAIVAEIPGPVINVTTWNPTDEPDWSPPEGEAVPCGPEVAMGDWCDGKSFSRPEPAVSEPAAPNHDAVRDTLVGLGLTPEIAEALASIAVEFSPLKVAGQS